MRFPTLILLFGVFLTSACSSACCEAPAEPAKAPVGQVLSTCGPGGSIVVSLGGKDGVRPGDVLLLSRGKSPIGKMIVHSANEAQAAGSVYGDTAHASVQLGDAVTPEE